TWRPLESEAVTAPASLMATGHTSSGGKFCVPATRLAASRAEPCRWRPWLPGLRPDQVDGAGVLALAGLVPVAGAVDADVGYRIVHDLYPHHLPGVPVLALVAPPLLELEDQPGRGRVAAPAGHGARPGVAFLAYLLEVRCALGLDPPGGHAQVEEHVGME